MLFVSEKYIMEVNGEVKEPGEEAGVKGATGVQPDSIPLATNKDNTGTNKPKDTETKGDMIQAADQETHPSGTFIKDLSDGGKGNKRNQEAGDKNDETAGTKGLAGKKDKAVGGLTK